ncbi:MAG: crossover junction endodeoxyribonuclease RuvC, partial [Acidimicrobiia bacterium]|nr:crossover junction endodeoxyribonuclease RuvC [Acidimicrobiia bacterium]
FEISPSAVKLAVTGYGRADKQQIRYAIMQQLKLKVLDAPADAADALALALSYVRSHRPNIPSGASS